MRGVSRPAPAGRVLLAVALLLAAANLVLTWGDVHRFGGTDLRARVVGARMLALGIDPYLPHPEAIRDEWLFDPHGVFRDISRCPYSPPLLAVYALLCWLPYPVERMLWFVLEWTSLLASIGWLSRIVRPRGPRPWFLVPALAFFAGGAFWRLHVERGQYYSLVLLLWTWSAARLAGRGGDDWGAGVPLGLAAALRPTAAVVAAPLWLLGYRKAATATAATIGAVVLVLLPATGLRLWRDYARLVDILERAVPGLPPVTSLPYSAWVEGADFTRVMEDRSANANVHLLLVTANARLGWPPVTLVAPLAKGAFVATLAVLLALVARGGRRRWRPRAALGVALTVAVVTDHFLPVRWGYADVLYLAPLALTLPFMVRPRGQVLLLLVIVGLALGHGMLPSLDAGTGSLVRAVLLTAALVGWTVAVTSRRRPRPAARASASPPAAAAASAG